MKIPIAGSHGTIGSAVTRHLLENGHEVVRPVRCDLAFQRVGQPGRYPRSARPHSQFQPNPDLCYQLCFTIPFSEPEGSVMNRKSGKIMPILSN